VMTDAPPKVAEWLAMPDENEASSHDGTAVSVR
jgi:hypothetical protein